MIREFRMLQAFSLAFVRFLDLNTLILRANRMRTANQKNRAFTLLELLMALAIFVIAGVSLAQAIQVISLTVSESVDQAVLREEARAILLEATRNPALVEGEREVVSNFKKTRYRVKVEAATLQNQKAATLPGLFEVVVETILEGNSEPDDSISTLVYPPMFLTR